MSGQDRPWEPSPAQLGKNWTGMFEQRRGSCTPPPMAPTEPAAEAFDDAEIERADPAEYRPWILQRGRGRPAMLLDLRRFERKSGLWMGWQLAYSHLVAVEYIGDRMVSLDFGTRQFVIEGSGLDTLAQHLQQGTVLGIVEHNAALWPSPAPAALVTAIRRIDGAAQS